MVADKSSPKTFAERAFEALSVARTANQGTLSRAEWIKIVDDLAAELVATAADLAAIPARRTAKRDKPPVHKRNELFDALAAACGHRGKVNRIAGATIGAALAAIREVEPEVTPDDLIRVTAATRRKFPDSGPMAVAAHWHELGGRRPTAQAAKLIAEPHNWQAWVNENAIDPTNATRPWASLALAEQHYISGQMAKT